MLRASSALTPCTQSGGELSLTRSNLGTFQPVAGADLLYARVARLEELLAAEQRSRNEAEARLTQHLNKLVGVSVTEQLDNLRQQLIDERLQRQVDVTAVRAHVETLRTATRPTLGPEIEELIRREAERVMRELHPMSSPRSLDHPEERGLAIVREQMEDFDRRMADMEARLESILSRAPTWVAPGTDEELHRLRSQFEDTISKLEGSVLERLKELRSDFQAALQASNVASSSSRPELEQIERMILDKTDSLRSNWRSLLEEEQSRSCERTEVLIRSLGDQFERSIISKAVTEARSAAEDEVGKRLKNEALDSVQSISGMATKSIFQEAELRRLSDSIHSLEGRLSALTSASGQQRSESQSVVNSLRRELEVLRARVSGNAAGSPKASDTQDVFGRITGLEEAIVKLGRASARAATIDPSIPAAAESLSPLELNQIKSEVRMQALREENLRLREVNMEMREHAAKSSSRQESVERGEHPAYRPGVGRPAGSPLASNRSSRTSQCPVQGLQSNGGAVYSTNFYASPLPPGQPAAFTLSPTSTAVVRGGAALVPTSGRQTHVPPLLTGQHASVEVRPMSFVAGVRPTKQLM